MERPSVAGLLFGSFPPAIRDDKIVAAVLVEVANAEAVIEPLHIDFAGSSDAGSGPFDERSCTGTSHRKPIGAVAVNQLPFAVVVDIEILRALVVGDGDHPVPRPRATL